MGGSVVEFSPSHLKQQENLPKAVNNETDLCSLTDLEFKREIVKILKELRQDMNSNAHTLRKELENIRRSQENYKLRWQRYNLN